MSGSPADQRCELYALLQTPLAGVVSCSVADCSRSVTRHAMYRTARGLLLPLRPLYLCDDHPLESVRLEGVDT